MAKRDTYKYELKQGNKIVYVGTTNNPERREAEHQQDKDFNKINIVGNKTTPEGARLWEAKRIKTYMKNHGGVTPKYNKTETG